MKGLHRMTSLRPVLFAAASALALAACSGEPEQPAPEGPDNLYESPEPLPAPEPLPELTPEPTPSPTPSPTPTPEPLPEDEQMMLDADATGMTSRVDREADPVGNLIDTLPADQE